MPYVYAVLNGALTPKAGAARSGAISSAGCAISTVRRTSFSVSPQVRRLALYDVDNLSIEDLHWKLKFADSGRLPGGQTRFVDVGTLR